MQREVPPVAPDEPSPARTTAAAPDKAKSVSTGELTAIRGIGIATQNRLNAAGIQSYAQLACATPGEVRKALGEKGRGAKVEQWIRQARKLTTTK